MAAVSTAILCEPRGFCAGVEMAIKSLNLMIERFGTPIYCYHDIVHNTSVVADFSSRGVIFVDSVEAVPNGAPIMLSAHGSSAETAQAAAKRSDIVVDAVCPLVKKVHHELRQKTNEGFEVLYVGHDGHDETMATMSIMPERTTLVSTVSEFTALAPIDRPVALLAQTTLSQHDWAGIEAAVSRKYPAAFTPRKSDLCFATTNRQNVLLEVAPRCDSFIVVGSKTSANAKSLYDLACDLCPNTFLVDDPVTDMPSGLGKTVGVISAASTPESVVKEVLAMLDPATTETVVGATEEEHFPLPIELRA